RRPGAAARRAARDGPRGRAAPAAQRPGRAHRDDEAPLHGLLDPEPLHLARSRHRRRRPDRRPRLPSARPRPARPARGAAAPRRRRLRPRRLPPARPRLTREAGYPARVARWTPSVLGLAVALGALAAGAGGAVAAPACPKAEVRTSDEAVFGH